MVFKTWMYFEIILPSSELLLLTLNLLGFFFPLSSEIDNINLEYVIIFQILLYFKHHCPSLQTCIHRHTQDEASLHFQIPIQILQTSQTCTSFPAASSLPKLPYMDGAHVPHFSNLLISIYIWTHKDLLSTRSQ